jgi:NUMOD4 motif
MYAYENCQLKSLKNEIWKDVPDYESYYQVSNFGRVKSLDRIIPHPRIHQQFVEGRMLKQKIVKDYNKLTNDAMVSMQVSLAKENKTHFYNVRRLVYWAFKGAIDFKKDGLYVINKDGDGYNNKLGNLQLVSKSKKQRRSIDSGRQDFMYLKTVDRSRWKKNTSKCMPVNQYTLGGRLVKRYSSLTEAILAVHVDGKGISGAAKGLHNGVYSGFKWKFLKKK